MCETSYMGAWQNDFKVQEHPCRVEGKLPYDIRRWVPWLPVFGYLPGKRNAFFLGAGAKLPVADRGRTLPEAAVAALVELNFAAQDFVAGHGAPALISEKMPSL